MTKVKSLTWNDRLALIDHFNPTDEKICHAFDVTPVELSTARRMRSAGTLLPTKNIDMSSYSMLFTNERSAPPTKSTPTSIKKQNYVNNVQQPETATKRTKVPKKRGRKGNNIAGAFVAIPETPTNAVEFAKEHSVSIAVLRQSKRFDKSPELGSVRVKKDKSSGDLMIWREPFDQD